MLHNTENHKHEKAWADTAAHGETEHPEGFKKSKKTSICEIISVMSLKMVTREAAQLVLNVFSGFSSQAGQRLDKENISKFLEIYFPGI